MAKKEKDKRHGEDVVDLSSRIGARPSSTPPPAPPPDHAPADALPPRVDAPLPPRRGTEGREESRPFSINPAEPAPIDTRMASIPPDETDEKSEPIPSPRTPPGPGETDVVVTPLPTLDDWHKFELALRRVRGIGQLRTEYYRHGVLKVRVAYEGHERLSHALRAGIPGYRVRVIGEGPTTLQILVSSETEERRPG